MRRHERQHLVRRSNIEDVMPSNHRHGSAAALERGDWQRGDGHVAYGYRVKPPARGGGAEGNRTPDLCSAIAALSHLSYGPARFGASSFPFRAMQHAFRAARFVVS